MLGRKFLKLLIKISCFVFLLSSVLPRALAEYRVFALFFSLGNYILIAIGVLAVIAFIIPMMKRKKSISGNTLILHDLPTETITKLFPNTTNMKFFCAARKMAHCKGFYDCWLKDPGVCALRDGVESLGKEIAQCDTLIIISKSLYGGLGLDIKNALDRSISFILPFFHVRNKESHHQTRYANVGRIQAYIYNADEMSQADQDAVREVIRAIGLNVDKQSDETIFVGDVHELGEVLR